MIGVVRARREPDDPAVASAGAPATVATSAFDAYLLAAVLRLRDELPGLEAAAGPDGAFPFLAGYLARLPDARGRGALARAWDDAERLDAGSGHRPLRALRRAGGLDHLALTLLFTAGLVDEDARFGSLFRALQPDGGPRPTTGLLCGWAGGPHDRAAAREAVARLARLGLLRPAESGRSGADTPVRPAEATWAAIRGGTAADVAAWATHAPASAATALDEIVLGPDEARRAAALPALAAGGELAAIVVRGPGSTGRRTLLAGVARELGRGTLVAAGGDLDPAAWRELGPLATALGAMPVVRLEPGPGEVVELPLLAGHPGPMGVVMPLHGGVSGPGLERAVTLVLVMPTPAERRRHWLAAAPGAEPVLVEAVAERHRLAGGHIRRAAVMAAAAARLDGRSVIAPVDVLAAGRALRGRALETLAPLVTASGSWSDLVVDDDAREELDLLHDRCVLRERLPAALPGAVGVRSAGVRALFSGPSGTGKTLAARVLAAELGMDLHALDLSTVVDKYLGETEKRITTVFRRAAELDALLLLDEGDALLTRRTDVASSNDRYANLQTNHLLQQLEAHDGIVVITTNAGDRIDPAFQRRIDVVVEFRAPDAARRWELWALHLPPEHAVDDATLSEVATRCALTGGQIRNAVLHAWLLAGAESTEPDGGAHRVARPITSADLEAAVRREYRKLGTVCPLRADRTAG